MSTHKRSGVLGWLRQATADERKALVAGGLATLLPETKGTALR